MDKVRNLVRNNKIKLAIARLYEKLIETERHDDIILLSSDWKSLTDKKIKGIIEDKVCSLEETKIKDRILLLARDREESSTVKVGFFEKVKEIASINVLYIVESVNKINENKIVYSNIQFPFYILNNSNSPLKDYKVKFKFSGEFHDVGLCSKWAKLLVVSKPKKYGFEYLESDQFLFSPKESILVPTDSIEMKELGFLPIKKEGEYQIKVNWLIISENCFDRGELVFTTKVKIISYEELQTGLEYDNSNYVIIEM